MALAIADANYAAPDPAALPEWSPPKVLGDAWKEHEELATASPPPAAYTPQQWRLYEAGLLRYEQLLRAGDDESAGRMRQTLDKLHDQIVQARQTSGDSMTLTLAAPAAFGRASRRPRKRNSRSVSINYGGIRRSRSGTSLCCLSCRTPPRTYRRGELLHIRLIGLLLDRAAGSHDDFMRACVVLSKLADPPAPPPAEANFAVMVQASEARLPGKTVASWKGLNRP